MEKPSAPSYDIPNFDREKSTSFENDSSSGNNSSTDNLVERSNWGNPIEFILSCLSYAVGLGNTVEHALN